jgi:hypothetical protein
MFIHGCLFNEKDELLCLVEVRFIFAPLPPGLVTRAAPRVNVALSVSRSVLVW